MTTHLDTKTNPYFATLTIETNEEYTSMHLTRLNIFYNYIASTSPSSHGPSNSTWKVLVYLKGNHTPIESHIPVRFDQYPDLVEQLGGNAMRLRWRSRTRLDEQDPHVGETYCGCIDGYYAECVEDDVEVRVYASGQRARRRSCVGENVRCLDSVSPGSKPPPSADSSRQYGNRVAYIASPTSYQLLSGSGSETVGSERESCASTVTYVVTSEQDPGGHFSRNSNQKIPISPLVPSSAVSSITDGSSWRSQSTLVNFGLEDIPSQDTSSNRSGTDMDTTSTSFPRGNTTSRASGKLTTVRSNGSIEIPRSVSKSRSTSPDKPAEVESKSSRSSGAESRTSSRADGRLTAALRNRPPSPASTSPSVQVQRPPSRPLSSGGISLRYAFNAIPIVDEDPFYSVGRHIEREEQQSRSSSPAGILRSESSASYTRTISSGSSRLRRELYTNSHSKPSITVDKQSPNKSESSVSVHNREHATPSGSPQRVLGRSNSSASARQPVRSYASEARSHSSNGIYSASAQRSHASTVRHTPKLFPTGGNPSPLRKEQL
ncbi:hypothetical protein BJ508DRAFT_410889 [Ascobolus immersus RN42]|uniref:Uncharacterized protein n=1 Tax=Ascobolus immersus RN42 TaxID=1160509 RepID=A0A3N4J0F5_ASCIM|nr:hypothetical protein BJ508DRAFT_410889 [Ascobolus immersus RN42]